MSYFDGKLKLIVASASGVEAITKRELTDMATKLVARTMVEFHSKAISEI